MRRSRSSFEGCVGPRRIRPFHGSTPVAPCIPLHTPSLLLRLVRLVLRVPPARVHGFIMRVLEEEAEAEGAPPPAWDALEREKRVVAVEEEEEGVGGEKAMPRALVRSL